MPATEPTITLFEDPDSRDAAERTVIIFGGRRGGTTAVAGIFRELGLFIGEDLEGNLEDLSFRKEHGLDRLRATIAARNAAHATWGWKHPTPMAYLPQLMPDLRNPRFVVVTRDMTAHGGGMRYREKRSPEDAMRLNIRLSRRNLDFVLEQGRPALFVSYEKLLVATSDTIRAIAAFHAVTPSDRDVSAIARFIAPGRYHRVADRGWAQPPLGQRRWFQG